MATPRTRSQHKVPVHNITPPNEEASPEVIDIEEPNAERPTRKRQRAVSPSESEYSAEVVVSGSSSSSSQERTLQNGTHGGESLRGSNLPNVTVAGSSTADAPTSTPTPPVTYNVLGRTPLVRVICKDGKCSPALALFASMGPPHYLVDVYCRIQFAGYLASCLSAFLGPGDRLVLTNISWNAMQSQEILLGIDINLAEGDSCQDLCKIAFNVERDLPSSEVNLPVTLHICHKCKSVWRVSTPPWSNHLAVPIPPNPLPLSNGNVRVWDSTPAQIVPGPPQYAYSRLSCVPTDTHLFFYAIIADVARDCFMTTMPKIGQLSALNVDVVDMSLLISLRDGLMPLNPAKISVMISEESAERIPLVGVGDVIRVHRTQVQARSNFKTGRFFIDANFVKFTSIRIWDLEALSAPSSQTSEQSQSFQTRSVRCSRQNSSQYSTHSSLESSEPSACEPYWRSRSLNTNNNGLEKWRDEAERALTDSEWTTITTLAKWADQSLRETWSLTHQYTLELEQLFTTDALFADFIVQVIDFDEVHPHYQQFNNSFFSQDGGPTHKFNSMGSRPEVPVGSGSKFFRIRVTDGSGDSDHLWILSNFPEVMVPRLKLARIGTWLRIRNVSYRGMQMLVPPSKFVPPGTPGVQCMLLDAFRSRVVKLPDFAAEVVHRAEKVARQSALNSQIDPSSEYPT